MSFKLHELKIEITHRCNLKCLHCSSEAHKGSCSEMSKDDCLRIIDDAAGMGIKKIAFSGGEPLLFKSIDEAVRQASVRGLAVTLYTSGNVDSFSESIRSLRERGMKKIIFSIYGGTPGIHDKITQVKGSFQKTVAATQTAIDNKIPSEFHFVPFSNNYQELNSIIQLSESLRVKKVSILRFVPQGRGKKNKNMVMKKPDWMSFRAEICRLQAEGNQIRTGTPLNILCLGTKTDCKAGIDRATILPDLSIIPCDAFKGVIQDKFFPEDLYSNIKGKKLSKCWERSLFLNKIRQIITRRSYINTCSKCSNKRDCGSGCIGQKVAYYSTFEDRCDPSCLFKK